MDYKQMGKFLFAAIIKKYNLEDEKIINLSEYLSKKDILNDDTISFLMELINSCPLFKKELIIEYLCQLYKQKYNEKNILVRYLNSTSDRDIYNFFNENDGFRKEIFNTFFDAIKTNTWNLNAEPLKDNISDEKEMEVEFLPDMIRNAFNYIFDYLYSESSEYEDVSELIFFCLTDKVKINLQNPRVIECFDFLKTYLNFFIRVMYADVLLFLDKEKQNTENIEDTEDMDATLNHIIFCAESNTYSLFTDSYETLNILDYFAAAIEDDEERINTKNVANMELLEIYASINPLNMIEDTGISRGLN